MVAKLSEENEALKRKLLQLKPSAKTSASKKKAPAEKKVTAGTRKSGKSLTELAAEAIAKAKATAVKGKKASATAKKTKSSQEKVKTAKTKAAKPKSTSTGRTKSTGRKKAAR
jgi:hypothetical protein